MSIQSIIIQGNHYIVRFEGNPSAEEKFTALVNTVVRQGTVIGQLQEDLRRSTTQLDAARQEPARAITPINSPNDQTTVTTLDLANAGLQGAVAAANQRLYTSQQSLEAREAQLNGVLAQLARANQELAVSEQRVAEMQDANRNLTAQLTTARQNSAELQRKLNVALPRIIDLESTVAQMQEDEYLSQDKDMRIAGVASIGQPNPITALRTCLEETLIEKKRLEEQVTSQHQEIISQRQEITSLKAQTLEMELDKEAALDKARSLAMKMRCAPGYRVQTNTPEHTSKLPAGRGRGGRAGGGAASQLPCNTNPGQ